MDVLPLSLYVIIGLWSVVPHGGMYSQAEKNVILTESHLTLLFWSSIVIAIGSLFGAFVAEKLRIDRFGYLKIASR